MDNDTLYSYMQLYGKSRVCLCGPVFQLRNICAIFHSFWRFQVYFLSILLLTLLIISHFHFLCKLLTYCSTFQ
jgi:hypothetical protein